MKLIGMEAVKSHSEQRADRNRPDILAAKLDQAIPLLRASVADNSSLVARFETLRDRLKRNRLQLAVLGQFKRGKSTFINALLGAPLLPIAVVPLTAVPIFISWRPSALVRVRFEDTRPPEELSIDDPDAIRAFLFRFVAEEANPENRLGVDRVDLFYPAAMLADGAVLIDTPGVGSTFRHNTEAALQVLPECDAVLFIVSADPPITEAELEYLRRVRSNAAKILFVLNKADYVWGEERARVAGFLRGVLKQNGLWPAGSIIFSVSARDGLNAKQKGDRKELESSGLAAIEAYLARYLVKERAITLAQAIAGKAEDILSQAAIEIDLRTTTLKMPLGDLSSKSQSFEHALRSIEEQKRVIHDLLAGEHRRLVEELKFRTDSLYEEVCAKLTSVIDQSLAGLSRPAWKDDAQKAVSTAMEAAFEAARERFIESFSADANSAFSAHQQRFEGLVDDVRRTAADIFETQFRRGAEGTLFELTNDPYWVTQPVQETLIPDSSGLVDRLLPTKLRRARLRERIIRKTNELVLRNASNLNWAILQSLNDTFRKAGSQFEERLDDAIRATKVVVEAVLVRRRDRTFEVEPEVARLDILKAALLVSRAEILDEERADKAGLAGDLCDAPECQASWR
jgi:GTP-binding protein EngB required for normal cell division